MLAHCQSTEGAGGIFAIEQKRSMVFLLTRSQSLTKKHEVKSEVEQTQYAFSRQGFTGRQCCCLSMLKHTNEAKTSGI